ncbi:ClpXP adapter SpxH family protein [Oceanobacillus salinisoli]|uniref:ClpXP adapter SpxH family protein n=1 Tax=Oceanobacillus salinisoli TaxID=2678611 RepID=UPI0012E19FCF|nr:ClpXP adapter SpxH family protein [Oceanobacillus salinisoli]
MSWDQTGLRKSNKSSTSENRDYLENHNPKPIEMYVFIDPLCPECWYFEPYLKKLTLEYGRFFTTQPIVSISMNRENFCKSIKLKDPWTKTKQTKINFDTQLEKSISNPWMVSLAIKAAEIQGKKAGKAFLRKIQEYLFLRRLDISKEHILMEIAQEANLDMEEFEEDLYSTSAKKAFQCDVHLTHEMEIDDTPTIVFFNHSKDEQGIKIAGLYPYEVYEFILQETLKINPIPSEKPPLEEFLKKYDIVGSKEISIVYDWSLAKTEKEMKKLQFRQKVDRIHEKQGTYWKYTEQP